MRPSSRFMSWLTAMPALATRSSSIIRASKFQGCCRVGELLAGHADEHHEMFQHLQACCLSAGDAAQVASLLEAIGGSQRHLRTARGDFLGRNMKMKGALRQKLLTLLPPLPLVALWEFVPENARPQLSPYQAVCVPAVDVRKLVRALSCLGTIARNMDSDFRKVCSEWKVTVRQNKRERPHKELQVDLRNACIELLARGQDSMVSPASEAGSAPGFSERKFCS